MMENIFLLFTPVTRGTEQFYLQIYSSEITRRKKSYYFHKYNTEYI